MPPINPKSRAELARGGKWNGRGAQGLAEDVRYYGKWMQEEAEKRIGHLYPTTNLPDGSEANVIAWLWARTVRSPDPAAKGAMVPLISSYLVSTKEGKKAWVLPIVDVSATDGYRFEIRTGNLTPAEEAELKKGTKTGRGSNFSCILTGAAIDGDYVKSEGKADRLGSRLFAIVAEAKRGRSYVAPSARHEQIAAAARPSADSIDMPTSTHPQYMGCVPYGLNNFRKLYTPRQLATLELLSDLVNEAHKKIILDLNASDSPANSTNEYADAIATYLAFVVDRAADYGSTLSTWLTDDNAIRGTFGRQALPMTWDYCEGNYFGDSSAALSTIIKT
jgi:putative DNA methylase